jgi:DNA-binding NarL/FixJ family response regulator
MSPTVVQQSKVRSEMRVLLADDQAKVRSALRMLLAEHPDIEILGEAVDTTGLLDWVKAACPDLVLLDWELPGLPADAILSMLHEWCPGLRVIALSGRPEAVEAALGAGADAFVSKGDPPEALLVAIEGTNGKENGSDAGVDAL